MTRFLLIRHAAHDRLGRFLDGRLSGVHLSDQGRAEADALGAHLRSEQVAAILTSPRDRTRETAEILGHYFGCAPTVDARLDEIDFGDWSGSSFEALEPQDAWRRWNHARSTAQTPAGDTMRASQARFLDAMDERRRGDPGGAIVLVSHADPIKAVLAFYLGLSLDLIGRFAIAPASVSRVEVDGWGAKVVTLNEVAPARADRS